MTIAVTLLALLIEATVGYPMRVLHAIGHPVIWIGALVGWLDRKLNSDTDSRGRRRLLGFVALFAIAAVPAGVAWGLERSLLLLPFAFVFVGVCASTLLAQQSLHTHVAQVAVALEQGGLAAGREAVSRIVGRDTHALDAAGVARAAIESLAENFSDGVVAPVFWLAIGGLAGGAAYKAINTADSMIGHRNARYADFGCAAARVDDLVNLPASRIAALLIIGAAAISKNASASAAWNAVLRDAHRHRSPNAGHPEAAMAGALGLALGGARTYGGMAVDEPTMGDGRRDAGSTDIRDALKLYRRADLILIVLVAAIAAVIIAPI
jgi:adenosylcobinamide-phosphate synthase